MKKQLLKITTDEYTPVYSTELSAGADLRSTIKTTINPGESELIPTGIKMDIPEGFEVQIRPRSGLAYKHKITVLNTPGTIDSDYRGEIGIILINHSNEIFNVEPGDRVAQMVMCPVVQASFEVVNELSETKRGEGGFGSTNIK